MSSWQITVPPHFATGRFVNQFGQAFHVHHEIRQKTDLSLLSLSEKIKFFARAALMAFVLTLALVFTGVSDVLGALTSSPVVAYRIGVRAALINVVYSVALIILAFRAPFGILPNVFPIPLTPEQQAERNAYRAWVTTQIQTRGFWLGFYKALPSVISVGVDPNIQDPHGRTMALQIIASYDGPGAMSSLLISLFVAVEQADPAQRNPVDLTIRDRNNFGPLDYALTGVIPEQTFNDGSMISCSLPSTVVPTDYSLLSLLIHHGAGLENVDFEAFKEFIQLVQNTFNRLPIASDWQETLAHQIRPEWRQNPYVRIVQAHCFPAWEEQRRENRLDNREQIVCLMQNAEQMIAKKKEILNLWTAQRAKHVGTISDGFGNSPPALVSELLADYSIGPSFCKQPNPAAQPS